MPMDCERPDAWIGRSQSSEEWLTPTLVERFGATLDRSFATAEGAAAPTLLHFCLAHPVANTADLGNDGHPRTGGFLPSVPLPRRMWAGGEIVFHNPIRIGDRIRRVSTVENVSSKTGRSGALWFVTVRHVLHSGADLAVVETQDIVYREPAAGPTPPRPPAPQTGESRPVTPSPALLFRYSALTFNSHRIHYDWPYSHGQENYDGLVVQGPMQATLLAQFAADLAPSPLRRFGFRSLSPILGHEPFSLNAERQGPGLRLWTSTAGGPVAMEATAEWQ